MQQSEQEDCAEGINNSEMQQQKANMNPTLRQLDFSSNTSYLITPQKIQMNNSSWVIQPYSPPTSPLLKYKDYSSQKSTVKINEFNNEDKERELQQPNKFVLGDINSLEEFNKIHYNIFQLKTSALLNLKCSEISSSSSSQLTQISLSNASTTNTTPEKDNELEDGNPTKINQSPDLILLHSSDMRETPITEMTTENNQSTFSSQSKRNKIHVDTECNCQTTQCIKKYCSCFANNNHCVPSICKCKSCLNSMETSSFSSSQSSYTISSSSKKANPQQKYKEFKEDNQKTFCTCSKTLCRKQYCECFKAGKKCTDLCRCVNCYNQQHKKINQQLQFDEISQFD